MHFPIRPQMMQKRVRETQGVLPVTTVPLHAGDFHRMFVGSFAAARHDKRDMTDA